MQADAIQYYCFHPYSETLQGESCGICQQDFSRGDAIIGHDNQHYLHNRCAQLWLKQKSTCPVCQSQVYPTPLNQKSIKSLVFLEKIGEIVNALVLINIMYTSIIMGTRGYIDSINIMHSTFHL